MISGLSTRHKKIRAAAMRLHILLQLLFNREINSILSCPFVYNQMNKIINLVDVKSKGS